MDGLTFTTQAFGQDWVAYLDDYGVPVPANDWLQKTITQAFEAMAPEEKALLHQWFAFPSPQPVEVIRRLQERLFDAMLEPLVTQRLSVFSTREIFTGVIRFRKEQELCFLEEQSSREAVVDTPNTDDAIIDVSGEPVPIDFSTDNAPSGQADGQAYDDNWKLGHQYQEKLGLNTQETAWLNKFWNPCNAFLEVEGCCVQTIRLYLLCLKQLNKVFDKKGTTIARQVKQFQDRYVQGNNNTYTLSYERQNLETHIYLTIFKRSENTVREVYRHKRKISNDFNYPVFANDFEQTFGSTVNEILAGAAATIAPADDATELLLNEMNVTRWKTFFDEIIPVLNNSNAQQVAEQLDWLGAMNEKNPALENIYFEASRAFVKADKGIAISFYLKYLYADLHSEKIDNRQLTKSIQKSLFADQEQLDAFEKIANGLIATRDLPAALAAAVKIYEKKRKKIELNEGDIAAVRSQSAETVSRLNEILQDEDEIAEGSSAIITLQLGTATPAAAVPQDPVFMASVQLSMHQQELLSLFKDHQYHLTTTQVTTYAKSRNLFRNQLVESINDCCYEELDDNLIEETEDRYEVNEFYYQKIINLC
ncbi:TerB-C domain-containing protein [Chitinophaga eiseniae]|uniref:TerB-C domain-containing protein n=1 Tax=Chitinophaga eiseniae TaxID=634771 RepID=A0A1T4T822_9BACT|nr:tellurite resistance TerB C-terminal domain-containing protein [Chitinophaga eiseniae]SKA36298.1 TerB-C domain-containing protein [Chitinophaga eiseniae]